MKDKKQEKIDEKRGILRSENNHLYPVDESLVNFCKKFSERKKNLTVMKNKFTKQKRVAKNMQPLFYYLKLCYIYDIKNRT